MTDRQILGYILLVLLILGIAGGFAYRYIAYKREMRERYGRRH